MMIETENFELAAITHGDPDAAKLALVLPGRLDTKDYAHMVSHVDFLAQQSFYAVSIDPPFSWESPGSTNNYSTTNYLKAVNELINQINKPTILIGHSRGGSISILASNNPHVRAIVPIMATYGPPSAPSDEDLKNGRHFTTRDLPPGTSRTVEQKELTLPLSYFEDGAKYDPETMLQQFKGPKLLICATNDAFIKPEEVRKVFDSLPAPKMFLELATEHDYRLHPDMIEAVNRGISEFLKTSVQLN